MAEKRVTFYGVDNGQAIFLSLDNETHLLFDIKQRGDGAEDKTADVRESLLKTLPRDWSAGRRHLSVFCLSHADLDHCQGVDRVFLLPDQNDGNGGDTEDLIRIDELWVTAQIFNEKETECANTVRKEAKRRLKLWSSPDTHAQALQPGNMLVVFGRYEDEPGIECLPEERHIGAGETFSTVCGSSRADFSAFVHWPFKAAVEEEDINRNEKSLVLQLTVAGGSAAAQILMGGDSGCEVWEAAYRQSNAKNNLNKLDWDVFVVPHHASYKFFTKLEHDEGRRDARDNPAEFPMAILNRGRRNGWIVCPSRPWRDRNYADGDPPHTQAIVHYEKRGEEIGRAPVCLMQHPTEDKPEPLVLRLTPYGLQMDERGAPHIAIGGAAVSQPARWG